MVASTSVNFEARIEAELAYAEAARERGKEGRARVCARRAASWAIAAHYEGMPRGSAVSRLKWLEANVDAPPQVRAAAGRLTRQITEDHELPHPEDPLKDARMIVDTLLGV